MTTPIDPRISSRHLDRGALVYVRQSSPEQVQSNVESTRLQLQLGDRAVALGWPDPEVITDDLGISASGFSDRPGFKRLLSAVAMREVGIILCFDASRLSRNSKDWAHLFELCGHFDTLIADLEQTYDLSLPNDRLLMGIKGTVSEVELSTLRLRMRTGLEAKAKRGELKLHLPPGYVYDPDDQVVFDPDQRVRHGIELMFERFEKATSVRQLALWYRDTKTLFPVRKLSKSAPSIAWEVPSASTVDKLLKHPIYAGAYVFGRRETRVEFVDGRLVKRTGRTRVPEEARVCIHDHHSAYITWEQHLANRKKMADNRPRWSMDDNKGAIRDGMALLVGILRCGQCGSRVYVNYKNKPPSALYYCDGGGVKGSQRCLSFGSKNIDRAVSEALCEALASVAIEAAEDAAQQREKDQARVVENARLRLRAAEYSAERAFEQFDRVDPKNRLVADSLERRWNDRLAEVDEARTLLNQALAAQTPLTDNQRESLTELARDFPRLWNHEKAGPATKKQLLRAAIYEIVVRKQELDQLEAIIHWHGGAHTSVHFRKRVRGTAAKAPLLETVRKLATQLEDGEIARVLNLKGLKTLSGLVWTRDRVRNFRSTHRIPRFQGQADSETMSANAAAAYLNVSRSTLSQLIARGFVEKHQLTEFAPWKIAREQLDSNEVAQAIATLRATGRLPQRGCPMEQGELFPRDTST